MDRRDPWAEMAPVWLSEVPIDLWRRHSDAANVALAERWLPGRLGALLKTDLFDEAVGPGILPALLPRASSAVGIDVEPAVRETAAARLPQVEVVAADVRRLPFADETFDTILSNSTLDHFADASQIGIALRELARVLRPRGRLLVTLDNPTNPIVALSKALPRAALNQAWARVGRRSARVGLVPYVVGATLPPAGLRDALVEAGLRPVATDTLVHAPRLAAVVVASLLERHGSRSAQLRFLRALRSCERLRGTPLERLTAHFHAALALRA